MIMSTEVNQFIVHYHKPGMVIQTSCNYVNTVHKPSMLKPVKLIVTNKDVCRKTLLQSQIGNNKQ